jgi:hypothetical protein
MSIYNEDMSWDDWSALASRSHIPIQDTLVQGERAYQKWYDYAYGKTNSEIATVLSGTVPGSVTEADVSTLQAHMQALHTAYTAIFTGNPAIIEYWRAF